MCTQTWLTDWRSQVVRRHCRLQISHSITCTRTSSLHIPAHCIQTSISVYQLRDSQSSAWESDEAAVPTPISWHSCCCSQLPGLCFLLAAGFDAGLSQCFPIPSDCIWRIHLLRKSKSCGGGFIFLRCLWEFYHQQLHFNGSPRVSKATAE